MNQSQNPARKSDAITALAHAHAQPARRRLTVQVLVISGVLVLVVGLALWWFLPAAEPADLFLAAYDQVAPADTTVRLHARLSASGWGEGRKHLGGREILFLQGESELKETAETGPDGSAAVEWGAPAAGKSPHVFTAQLMKRKEQPGKREARNGSVFVWPADARLLVIDADHALADADAERLAAAPLSEIKPRDGAAAALRGLGKTYRVVYVTADMGRPDQYQKMRLWLRQTWAPEQDRFPAGPLLAPAHPLGEADPPIFFSGEVERLKKAFPQKAVGVAARKLEAEIFLDAGWQTFQIGDGGDAPAGATVVPSWAELAKRLKQ
ncbi:MAG TPA: hypothetical protein VFA26_23500 [Gemmataceae bacterium]|nr:hypothetical protein [Gemmataceae bacterium]